ncbi:sugar-transfer associated ATP-grasp domain-containing protein [Miltoncostaea oceani]|uniref:sugar-transfer associated ATP-grasp domain-containing protein n=1 Tax=Miltoncostaea oceani TaxID=2843216 RepID=UPI001C3C7915|nr:sugar-transfer associated ATP-grasp domain-containing protein [Miltoncostaea oceani]
MGAVAKAGSRVAHAATWRARAVRDHVARTIEIARATRRAHGAGPLAVGARALDMSRRGFTLDEAFALGLLDPGRPAAEVDDLLSKRRLIGVQSGLNPNEFWYLTEDKAIFYRLAEALGLPVPRLYAILCQSGPGWTRDGTVLAEPDDWARYLATGAPDEFVVKPARGYHGLGVRVVTRRPDGVLDVMGAGPTTVSRLCGELAADRQFHVHVVQERLRDHPDLPGDGSALQTLRIVTFVARDGTVEVVNAQFRMTAPGNPVDNFSNGTTGNVLAIIDLRDGTMGEILHAGPHREYLMTPAGTWPGGPPAGARLPCWEGIVAAVTSAAPHFLPHRAIGWDVAITPDGPRIVEANIWWDSPSPQAGIAALAERMRTT